MWRDGGRRQTYTTSALWMRILKLVRPVIDGVLLMLRIQPPTSPGHHLYQHSRIHAPDTPHGSLLVYRERARIRRPGKSSRTFSGHRWCDVIAAVIFYTQVQELCGSLGGRGRTADDSGTGILNDRVSAVTVTIITCRQRECLHVKKKLGKKSQQRRMTWRGKLHSVETRAAVSWHPLFVLG